MSNTIKPIVKKKETKKLCGLKFVLAKGNFDGQAQYSDYIVVGLTFTFPINSTLLSPHLTDTSFDGQLHCDHRAPWLLYILQLL